MESRRVQPGVRRRFAEAPACAIKSLSAMPTIIVRDLSQKIVKSLKAIARKNHRSMEQEVRDLLERHVGDRVSALRQIEEAWEAQSRRTTAEEVESWIVEGRH
jgi:plasmid stability protein